MVQTLDDRFAVPQWSSAGDFFPDQSEWSAFWDDVNDNAARDGQGTRAARPAAGTARTAGVRGGYYFATDGVGGSAKALSRSDGAAWHEIALLGARADFTKAITVAAPAAGGTSASFTDGANSSLRVEHPLAGLLRFDVDAGNNFDWTVASSVRMGLTTGGNLSAMGADHRFGVNADLATAGSHLHVGSMGDASNAYVRAEGSTTTIGLMLRAQGAAATIRMQPDASTTVFTASPTAITLAAATSITAGGLNVTGSPTGYDAEIRFPATTNNANLAWSSLATGVPSFNMDHRAVGNTGQWQMRNDTGGSQTRFLFGGGGDLTMAGQKIMSTMASGVLGLVPGTGSYLVMYTPGGTTPYATFGAGEGAAAAIYKAAGTTNLIHAYTTADATTLGFRVDASGNTLSKGGYFGPGAFIGAGLAAVSLTDDGAGNALILPYGAAGTMNLLIRSKGASGQLFMAGNAGTVGLTVSESGGQPHLQFFAAGLGSPKLTAAGSRGGNGALASVLYILDAYGLLVDATTA